jgi:hypothetical protein
MDVQDHKQSRDVRGVLMNLSIAEDHKQSHIYGELPYERTLAIRNGFECKEESGVSLSCVSD